MYYRMRYWIFIIPYLDAYEQASSSEGFPQLLFLNIQVQMLAICRYYFLEMLIIPFTSISFTYI